MNNLPFKSEFSINFILFLSTCFKYDCRGTGSIYHYAKSYFWENKETSNNNKIQAFKTYFDIF